MTTCSHLRSSTAARFSYCCRWRLLLLLALLGGAALARAQAPAWQLAVGATPATPPAAATIITISTAADAAGNVFVTGEFSGAVTLGSTQLVSAGGLDMFVAKWNTATRAWAWATRGGGTSDDSGHGVAVSNGSVYVTGNFRSPTVDFAGTTFLNAGLNNVFTAKYTDLGSSFANGWAARAGGIFEDLGQDIAVSGPNVYVTGLLNSPLGGTFAGTVLTPVGGADVFVAKYVDAGSSFTNGGALRAGGAGNDQGLCITVAGSNVYVVGSFESTPGTFAGTTLASAGSADIFVAKYVDAGSGFTNGWAQRAGGVGYDFSRALAVSGSSVYLAGTFQNTAAFGPTTLASAGGNDVCVAKYTDNGSSATPVWAVRDGGSGDDRAQGLAVSGSGLYVTGSFERTPSFGPTTLTSAGATDLFVAAYTDAGPTGMPAWATSAGGVDDEGGIDIAVRGSTLSVVGYSYSARLSFGPLTLPNSVGLNFFLAQLPTAVPTPTRAAGVRADALALWPNPVPAGTSVRLLAAAGGPASVEICDALGRVVRPAQALGVAAGQVTGVVPTAGLAPGLYVLRLVTGTAGLSQRLLVE